MEASRREDEERALAFAGLAICKAVIAAFERKGVLNEHDITSLFDEALASLEYRAQDPAIGLARRIVEGTSISRRLKND